MDAPDLEFSFRITVDVGNVQEVGSTAKGLRRVVPISGGIFEGPHISGLVMPGGYDWQLIRTDSVAEIDARYMLQTDDGALITIMNTGIRHASPEVMQRLANGDEVEPSEYYFRSIPVFETGSPAYSWLTSSVFIANGVRKPKQVLIDVWQVL